MFIKSHDCQRITKRHIESEVKHKKWKWINGWVKRALEHKRLHQACTHGRIKLSQGFTDTYNRRYCMIEEILTTTIEKCRARGIYIPLSDMRYGVKDENTYDHLTWLTSHEQIKTCHENSDTIFFISYLINYNCVCAKSPAIILQELRLLIHASAQVLNGNSPDWRYWAHNYVPRL